MGEWVRCRNNSDSNDTQNSIESFSEVFKWLYSLDPSTRTQAKRLDIKHTSSLNHITKVQNHKHIASHIHGTRESIEVIYIKFWITSQRAHFIRKKDQWTTYSDRRANIDNIELQQQIECTAHTTDSQQYIEWGIEPNHKISHAVCALYAVQSMMEYMYIHIVWKILCT